MLQLQCIIAEHKHGGGGGNDDALIDYK